SQGSDRMAGSVSRPPGKIEFGTVGGRLLEEGNRRAGNLGGQDEIKLAVRAAEGCDFDRQGQVDERVLEVHSLLELEVLVFARELPKALRGEVTRARLDLHAGAPNLDSDAVELAIRARLGWRIAQQVISGVLLLHLAESPAEIVRIVEGPATGVRRQRGERFPTALERRDLRGHRLAGIERRP